MDTADELLRLTRRLRVSAAEHLQPVRWRPAADVYRIAAGWLVKMELAGVRSEEIEILPSGSLLLIRGRRADATVVEEGEFYSMEIAYSQFERAIQFPCSLERARTETHYQDGMLLVRVITEEAP